MLSTNIWELAVLIAPKTSLVLLHFHISQELSIDLLNWLTHPGLMRVQPPLALWYYMPANISLQMSGYERAS